MWQVHYRENTHLVVELDEMNHEMILRRGQYQNVEVDTQSRDIALELYAFMVRLRRMQLALMEEYHPADEMRCPIHFCVGQEAVPAALSRVISTSDYLLSHHRSHGYFLAKGGNLNELFAEIYGKTTGTNGGFAGSQEISKVDLNFYSGAIITGMVAIAMGVAFANQYLDKQSITFACHGDGATEEGAFWEAVSLAALKRLPVIFICENNGYSTYSPQNKRQAIDNIHQRVAAFGLRSHAIFGNDVFSVLTTLQSAVAHVRCGAGPVFIEAYTYRHYGHVGPEDDDYIGYRPEEERRAWMQNCPVTLLENALVQRAFLDRKMKRILEDRIDEEIAEAFTYAKQSRFPEIPAEWEGLNCNTATPLADALLADCTVDDTFNGDQTETKLMPY